jgi:hypothetical protein
VALGGTHPTRCLTCEKNNIEQILDSVFWEFLRCSRSPELNQNTGIEPVGEGETQTVSREAHQKGRLIKDK